MRELTEELLERAAPPRRASSAARSELEGISRPAARRQRGAAPADGLRGQPRPARADGRDRRAHGSRRLSASDGRAPFVHELRVRYGECDPQGIVFNANYLLYFDVAFTELWREAVGPVAGDGRARHRRGRRPRRHRLPRAGALRRRARAARRGSAPRPHRDHDRDRRDARARSCWSRCALRHVCVATETWQKTDVPRLGARGPASAFASLSRAADAEPWLASLRPLSNLSAFTQARPQRRRDPGVMQTGSQEEHRD